MLTSIGIYPLCCKRHKLVGLDYHFEEEPLTCETTTLRIIRPYSRFRTRLYTYIVIRKFEQLAIYSLLTTVELKSLPTGEGRLPGDATEKERVIIFANNSIRLNLTWVCFYHIV